MSIPARLPFSPEEEDRIRELIDERLEARAAAERKRESEERAEMLCRMYLEDQAEDLRRTFGISRPRDTAVDAMTTFFSFFEDFENRRR